MPKFSSVGSRRNVDISTVLGGRLKLNTPILSANMETVTNVKMAREIARLGGLAVLHRFCSISDNVSMLKESIHNDESLLNNIGVSIGISEDELQRASSLAEIGAWIFVLDVAFGAQQIVVDQYLRLRDKYPESFIIVGNFANPDNIYEFESRCNKVCPDVYKIGIGPGRACLTRVKTKVGVPQLSAIIKCAEEYHIIADGGCNNPADVCCALAAGAEAVMLGGMLSGTEETPGSLCDGKKLYKGSASVGYGYGWKTSEGTSFPVDYKGPVELVIKDIEGGLRSSMTYVNASNLEEYRANAEFIKVSPNTVRENGARPNV